MVQVLHYSTGVSQSGLKSGDRGSELENWGVVGPKS